MCINIVFPSVTYFFHMRYSPSLAPPRLEDLRNMVLPTALRVAGRNDRSRKSYHIITVLVFGFSDLAAIRKLLEEGDGDETCPSCGMPFDKGKKRKLIDSCGHERCYACMFRNEGCPLCATAATAEEGSTKGMLDLNSFFNTYNILL